MLVQNPPSTSYSTIYEVKVKVKKLYFFGPLILNYAELVVPNKNRTGTKKMHLSSFIVIKLGSSVCVWGGEVPNNIFKITVLLEWDDSFEIKS